MESEEPKLVRDTNAAALAAVGLLVVMRKELALEHNNPNYADEHPEVLAMCMNAAALWHISGIQELAHGLVERFK